MAFVSIGRTLFKKSTHPLHLDFYIELHIDVIEPNTSLRLFSPSILAQSQNESVLMRPANNLVLLTLETNVT